MAHSKDFRGKTVLVTGSSSGIGEEIVIQFAKYGAQVIVTGRQEEKINAVVKKCNKVSPNNLKAFKIAFDITKDDEVRAAVDMVIETFDGLDILVNNAGIARFGKIGNENIMAQFDTIMRVNLRVPFFITHLFSQHLIKSKGNIINISSIAGIHAVDCLLVYSSCKAALDMFTKCLALDLGPKGVRVNSVNPATTRTPLMATLGANSETLSAMERECVSEYPLQRVGEVEDVAKMVLFLASGDASFVTGLIAQVDGGALHTLNGASLGISEQIRREN